jgi:nucleoside-diphosphate-sugar epimerase
MILVTGGTGFIGSHLVDRLLARGERVRALVRPRPGRTELFGRLPVEVAMGDLATGAGLADALRGVSLVIHLAGVTKALSVGEYYTGNVKAVENLACAVAAAANPIRMVHVSSVAAIGPSMDGVPVTEDAAPHPLTHYGKSKLSGERTVREILPEAVILRPPVVYGPRDTDVFQMLKSISHGMVMEIAGGERWFSAIYVTDLADGIISSAQQPQAAGRSYFLAHRKPVSWGEFGAIAAQVMGKTPRVLRVPVSAAYTAGYCAELWARLTRKPGIVSREKVTEAQCRHWTCDPGRARNEFGFDAPTGMEDGLARALAWYREAGWLKY